MATLGFRHREVLARIKAAAAINLSPGIRANSLGQFYAIIIFLAFSWQFSLQLAFPVSKNVYILLNAPYTHTHTHTHTQF
jgi:hypothetical protein